MLLHLSIRNIVIIEHLELDFKKGMTVLTGETGAGKSILLESLGFSLGERSDKTLIRHGAESAEVTVLYDIQRMPEVISWLYEKNLIETTKDIETVTEHTLMQHSTLSNKNTSNNSNNLSNLSNLNNSHNLTNNLNNPNNSSKIFNNSSDSISKTLNSNVSTKGTKKIDPPLIECIIRRILTKDGRSRCFINGTLVPISQLKELAEHLVNIHGQHQNQLLLRTEHQRILLDQYSNHPELVEKVQEHYFAWQKLQQELGELLKEENQQDKLSLLSYQIEEFKELNLKTNEIELLDAEHKALSHAEQWFSIISDTAQLLQNDNEAKSNHFSNNQNLLQSLDRAIQNLKSFSAKNAHSKSTNLASNIDPNMFSNISNVNTTATKIDSALALFKNAQMQIEEGLAELNDYLRSVDLDPARLKKIDERLGQIHNVARKHKVPIEQLTNHFENLIRLTETLAHRDEKIKLIQDSIEKTEKLYFMAAKELSASRQKHAKLLEQKVTAGIHSLEMLKGQFNIGFSIKGSNVNKDQSEAKNLSKYGIDDIEFLVCTNPGQPLQPLRKIASGGELSRISLCIQVITAEKMTTPTLIFDEVDVGISGKTATVVGALMRQIGETTQVFCVTHLPQVAALGHQHFCVSKQQLKDKTEITVVDLNYDNRITEIARMFASSEMSDSAINHAKTILDKIHKKTGNNDGNFNAKNIISNTSAEII